MSAWSHIGCCCIYPVCDSNDDPMKQDAGETRPRISQFGWRETGHTRSCLRITDPLAPVTTNNCRLLCQPRDHMVCSPDYKNLSACVYRYNNDISSHIDSSDLFVHIHAYLVCTVLGTICGSELMNLIAFIISLMIFCWRWSLLIYLLKSENVHMYLRASVWRYVLSCLFSWEKPYVCVALLLVCNIFCIFLPVGKCQLSSRLSWFRVFGKPTYCNSVLYLREFVLWLYHDIYTMNRKNTPKCFLIYSVQNQTDCDKIWYVLSWVNLSYRNVNIFRLTWIVSLPYLLKLSIRVLQVNTVRTVNRKIHQMFLSCLLQNEADSDKVWYTFSWLKLS